MRWMYISWITIQILVGYNLVVPFVLFYFWRLKKNDDPSKHVSLEEADYAIIVTAYQQTDMLPIVVESILKVNYNNYLVYVVADNCDVTSLVFNSEKVILLKPIEILASNTASHFYAINRFVRSHERLTIIDSDNIVHPEYLNSLNNSFSSGVMAVQGLRKPKNLNTTYACLDAARDIYYHFYDGKLLFELGSSATLSGSGMAFTTKLYRDSLEPLNINGAGFDKVLQATIVGKNQRIGFNEFAIVFDEKTSKSDQLVEQRARWINSWFKYFKYGFQILKASALNRSLNQLLFGLILLRPPLFIFILLSLICMVTNFFISATAVFVWAFSFLLFVISFVRALQYSKADKRIYDSLKNIPNFIFFQVKSLLKSRGANKASVSTTHYHTDSI